MLDVPSVVDIGQRNRDHRAALDALITVGEAFRGAPPTRSPTDSDFVDGEFEYFDQVGQARGKPFDAATGEVRSVARRAGGPATSTEGEHGTNLFREVPGSRRNSDVVEAIKTIGRSFVSGHNEYPRLPDLKDEQVRGLRAARDALGRNRANGYGAHHDTVAHLNDLLRGSGIQLRRERDADTPRLPPNRDPVEDRLGRLESTLERMDREGRRYRSLPRPSRSEYSQLPRPPGRLQRFIARFRRQSPSHRSQGSAEPIYSNVGLRIAEPVPEHSEPYDDVEALRRASLESDEDTSSESDEDTSSESDDDGSADSDDDTSSESATDDSTSDADSVADLAVPPPIYDVPERDDRGVGRQYDIPPREPVYDQLTVRQPEPSGPYRRPPRVRTVAGDDRPPAPSGPYARPPARGGLRRQGEADMEVEVDASPSTIGEGSRDSGSEVELEER